MEVGAAGGNTCTSAKGFLFLYADAEVFFLKLLAHMFGEWSELKLVDRIGLRTASKARSKADALCQCPLTQVSHARHPSLWNCTLD